MQALQQKSDRLNRLIYGSAKSDEREVVHWGLAGLIISLLLVVGIYLSALAVHDRIDQRQAEDAQGMAGASLPSVGWAEAP